MAAGRAARSTTCSSCPSASVHRIQEAQTTTYHVLWELTQSASDAGRVRVRVRVRGTVQGVGYRPFVHALAAELGVAGFVGNDPAGVFAEAEGPAGAVEAFVAGLRDRAAGAGGGRGRARTRRCRRPAAPASPSCRAPAGRAPPVAGLARTRRPARTAWPSCGTRPTGGTATRSSTAPTAGPRFTVVTGIPYDRPLTTMAGFAMCADCAREYADPGDRRFHAQPVCCPACGPRARCVDAAGAPVAGDPEAAAAELLRGGAVLAVKGLGGYHLAVRRRRRAGGRRLRARKHREERPFAVLAAGPRRRRGAGAPWPPVEAGLLTGRRRPIVLLVAPARTTVLAPSVAPGQPGGRRDAAVHAAAPPAGRRSSAARSC